MATALTILKLDTRFKMETVRSLVLLISVPISWRCGWVCFRTWWQANDRSAGFLVLVFWGWSVSATNFAYRYWFGEAPFGFMHPLVLPTVATLLMCYGGEGFIRSLGATGPLMETLRRDAARLWRWTKRKGAR